MSFSSRKESNTHHSCAFEQHHPYSTSSSHGGMFHRPTTTDYNNNTSHFTLSPSSNSNNKDIFQFENFVFPTPEEEKESLSLPCGWTIAGRKRSIFELETNIHTLGELYTTLIELRNQLPTQQEEQQPPPFMSRRSSSFITVMSSSRRSSSNTSIQSPLSYNEEDQDLYYSLISTYPEFIFTSLLKLSCCTTLFKKNIHLLEELFQQDKLNKAYASALFGYTALHALYCHSDKYGIYTFLKELAHDAYTIAHELLEFDTISSTTVETLVLMYQYLLLLGNKEAKARTLFCLAWRHMELLKDSQHHYRLLLWMTELDWQWSITKGCTPMIDRKHITAKRRALSNSMEDMALVYRIKGLNLILNHIQLNDWRLKYLKTFLYKREANSAYNTEDKLALGLHALYFSGMLHYYQHQMMTAFEFEEKNDEWADYFSTTTTKTKTKVEKSLYSCMNAALGFVKVVKLLLEEGDTCSLIQMVDTLSAAYTVLYFGNKVTTTPPQEILVQIIQHVSTLSIIQCPHIVRFVNTWSLRLQ